MTTNEPTEDPILKNTKARFSALIALVLGTGYYLGTPGTEPEPEFEPLPVRITEKTQHGHRSVGYLEDSTTKPNGQKVTLRILEGRTRPGETLEEAKARVRKEAGWDE